MRILLASNAQYFPAHGGGERSNRMLMEALAARGHDCLVISRSERFGLEGATHLRTELTKRGLAVELEANSVRFKLNAVDVRTATSPTSFRAFFVAHKNAFKPDVVITSTDDPAQLLLEAALEDEGAVTVFLARATIALPFGGDAAFTSGEKTDMLRQVDGVVGVSNYVAGYIRLHSGIEAVHVPIALAEPGPHPNLGQFDNAFVTLANPCAVKGLGIFIGLARALPRLAFAGVPTWGTTAEDLALMQAEPNITILPKVDRINDLLVRTRVLLVPSLWTEARSRIVVEAMLAGVPVMASNLGGLPEAKMHVPYILPVNPVEGYTQQLNEQMVPIANVPEQDIGPWKDALERLTADRAHWEEIAQVSREAALQYAEATTIEPFERYIGGLKRRPRAAVRAKSAPLSPQRRKLLELKLRRQSEASDRNAALPFGAAEAGAVTLFCFPHAGGSAGFFRNWKASVAGIAPVQYPGHETRRGEAFTTSLAELVTQLAEELKDELSGGFSFFGHSMGAIVAFELARKLATETRAGPDMLIASAARAPVFRLNHVPGPAPTRAELLEQVRALGGVPAEILEDERAASAILPALEADAALYRAYRYEPEPILQIPVLALGGRDDAHVALHHLERWAEVTAQGVRVKQFDGGHFFLRQSEAAVLHEIKDALAKVRERGNQ